jgi:ABC-type uncharacterized transport system substrate-binding protein
MKRREFITLVGGAAASLPIAAHGQQPQRRARIGYLSLTSASQETSGTGVAAFRAGLRDLGYVEGRNLQIELRFADGHEDRLPGLAADLIGLNVDVILTYATGVPVVRRATATIPIVMATFGDPVATGLVANLAHPGGNLTGLTFFLPEIMAKRLELMKETIPTLSAAGVLLIRTSPSNASVIQAMETTAKALGVRLHAIEANGSVEIERAFSAWAENQVGAVVILDHTQFLVNAGPIAALALKNHLPSIGALAIPAAGGLLAYGVTFSDMFYRAATFVHKILRGEKPGEIPIEQATKFGLVINLKTAKSLGVEIPPGLLARVDEVIE